MQIPVLNGIYTDNSNDLRVKYPVNLSPIFLKSGVSNGYLKLNQGIVSFANVSGVDRGGINWNGILYRVVGNSFVSITELGAVSVIYTSIFGYDQVIFDYSFDYLAICANGSTWLFDGATVTQITDADLGVTLDVVWVDGYFMTTDGEFLVVTELNDPFSVNPIKYGSSEADPDKIVGLVKIVNEVYAVNRHTIEVFNNVGGDLFPFQRVEGAQIQKGAVGTHCCCVFIDAVAFIGGGRNESISVYLASAGQTAKIATREIDLILSEFDESILAECLVEQRIDKDQELLLVHLPNKTLVYDAKASKMTGESVWFILSTSLDGDGRYLAKNHVYCYNKWIVGHPELAQIGYLSESLFSHWGVDIGWEFNTVMLFNESFGAIVNQLELITLTGRSLIGTNPQISTMYSLDGQEWSTERFINAGKTGHRDKRLIWLQNGMLRNWRIQKFKGKSDSKITVVRLEAQLEPLSV